ncbi:MAG TPA: alkaline phosphatase family protein [Gemmatimonadaceae bacterium]|nr:alkaline phosphatase family protein [Gemmatimonadaceae bacterium]
MQKLLTRRDFVGQAALMAGAGIAACTDGRIATAPAPSKGSLDHIVVVTMENRSFDHLLGWLPGADGRQAGLSYRDRNGVAQPTHHLTEFHSCGFADPNHSFAGGRQEYNNGSCDGWLTTPGNDIYAIGYYEAADLPFLGKAAPEWLVLDRFFCALMGPTLPNRVVSIAGQTDRLSNTLVTSTLPTIWDRLLAAGQTGLNYGSGLTTSTLWGTKYSSIIRPISQFYSDAASGSLPSVAFVDPDLSPSGNSYHPPGDIRNAEAFLGRVYKAVTESPSWSKSLLVITFDEWGGFFDHVPPPIAPIPPAERDIGNTDGLRGFRVPTILVSPYVKRRSVSSRIYDQASVLRLIERRWNLPSLTVRDAQANDLMDEIDLDITVSDAPRIDVPAGPFGTPC